MIDLITQRSVVISLAVLGALLVTLANWFTIRHRLGDRLATRLTELGYVIVGLSVVAFIVAGFRSG